MTLEILLRKPKAKPKTRGPRIHKPLMIYITDKMLAELDEWRRGLEGEPCRSDAMRRALRRCIDAAKREASAA